MEVRVLVCGSRTLHDPATKLFIEADLSRLEATGVRYKYVLCHGNAKGVDTLANEIALDFGWDIVRYIANWTKWGKAAGPMRNTQMIEEFKPNVVYAYPKIEDGKILSRGTWDCIQKAIKAGILTHVRGIGD